MEIYFGTVPLILQPTVINDSEIDQVTVFKLFGPMIDTKLSWNEHVECVCGKTSKKIYFLVLLKRAGRLPSDIIDTYTAIIRSVLEYACIAKQQSDQIEHIQKLCLSISLQERREVLCKTIFMSIQNVSHRLLNYLLPLPRDFVSLQKFRKYEPPLVKTKSLMRSPINYGLFKF